MRVDPKEWSKISTDIHAAAFKELRPPTFDRYNFALVVCDDVHIYAYSTVIEIDAECAYMQHGGAMPEFQKSLIPVKAYRMMTTWLKERFNRLSTRIQNTNTAMIKLALNEGFVIDGIISYEKETFLSLGWGF